MIVSDTPVETYRVSGVPILVKRDDLMGDNDQHPPWGKLIGIRSLVRKLDPTVPVVHLNVFGSWSGWALSKIHRAPVYVVHPNTKKISDRYLDKVTAAGGQLHPIRHNVMKVLYSQAKNFARDRCYQMMPYAFDDTTYINSMRDRVATTLGALGRVDNLVVSSGSGVTTVGVVKAFLKHNPAGRFVTVCVSSEKSVWGVLGPRGVLPTSSVTVVKSDYEFGDLPPATAPFPCNQFWDIKAWHWLTQHATDLKRGRTLFWNLGGEYTF